MKRRIIVSVVGFVVLASTGCGTVAGLGRDMTNLAEWTGRRVQGGFVEDRESQNFHNYEEGENTLHIGEID